MILSKSLSLLITIGLISAALGCYALGLIVQGTALLVLGGVFELLFWLRILRRRH